MGQMWGREGRIVVKAANMTAFYPAQPIEERIRNAGWVGVARAGDARVAAADITGRVIGITGDDTLTILNEARQKTKVRLAEIDTPESRQLYGSRA